MIDRKALWITVLKSWGFTLMGVFNILFLLLLAGLLTARFAGPAVVVVLIIPTFAFATAVFFGGELIVNLIFRAEAPHPERDARFISALKNMSRKSGMWVRPRGWILHIGGLPNAMAYGPGLPFLSAVGVSRELVDMLDDDELEGVLAHELAHIRCRDTGILAVIGLVLGLIDKLHNALMAGRALLLQNPITLVIAWVVYGIGRAAFYISRFSISQERELAADALGASYKGDARPLISGLRKLHERMGAKDDSNKPIFHDLMVAHPGLEERVQSLENIMKKEY